MQQVAIYDFFHYIKWVCFSWVHRQSSASKSSGVHLALSDAQSFYGFALSDFFFFLYLHPKSNHLI